jgi:TonB family protein
MKNRIAVALFVLLSVLTLGPSRARSQEAPQGLRKVVTKVMPQYPSLARTMNIQGVVRAEVLVAPNGTVKSVEIKGGHPLLAQAAQNALREWRWEPAAHETHESVELKFNP